MYSKKKSAGIIKETKLIFLVSNELTRWDLTTELFTSRCGEMMAVNSIARSNEILGSVGLGKSKPFRTV
jgi:hypothetical protein